MSACFLCDPTLSHSPISQTSREKSIRLPFARRLGLTTPLPRLRARCMKRAWGVGLFSSPKSTHSFTPTLWTIPPCVAYVLQANEWRDQIRGILGTTLYYTSQTGSRGTRGNTQVPHPSPSVCACACVGAVQFWFLTNPSVSCPYLKGD